MNIDEMTIDQIAEHLNSRTTLKYILIIDEHSHPKIELFTNYYEEEGKAILRHYVECCS